MPQLPDDVICWRKWNEETLKYLQDRKRPILLFVADTHPMVFPFLGALFNAMPANAKLRNQLKEDFPAVFIEAEELPDYLRGLGAGSAYHVAILSPNGFTPIAMIDHMSAAPEELVNQIALVLENLSLVF